MSNADDDLAARLAAIHEQLDQPPGVMLGVLRLPILDPILDELERIERPKDSVVLAELTRLAELLAKEMLGAAPETVARRGRIIELLRRSDAGRVPALAADDQDPFGLELRAMLDSDDALRSTLGRLYPLTLRATSVAPSAAWLREARRLADGAESTARVEATRRILAALVRAPIESRPDLLAGGVRFANQRLARGLLWFAAVALEHPAETLRAVGLRMGTSGRSDAVVRDVALANTCAVLLGRAADPDAPAALASMRSQVTNRNVLKQADRALEVLAAAQGMSVDDLVDRSLPTFGLGADARLEIAAGRGHAVLAVTDAGDVEVGWRGADGTEAMRPPTSLGVEDPGAIAEVERTTAAIEAALAEERRRLEARLGSTRSWPEPVWRSRFGDHPVARPFARRLVWVLDRDASETVSVLPHGGGWIGVDERPVGDAHAPARLRLWHPAEVEPAEVAAWRATITSRAVQQPFRQVDREVFRPAPQPEPPNADRRFAGRVVAHTILRALLRERGWAVPALGAWDQGDEATGWRAFEAGLRAELRYQATERASTGTRIDNARLVAVRFIRTDAPAAAPAGSEITVPLTAVPPRAFSEALRDVSLAVAVGERSPQP